MAFKAEELTSKVFPASGAEVWAGCPQDTMPKGKPCNNTKPPCPPGTVPPGGPDCPQDTMPTHKPPRSTRERDAATLALLRTQLRDQLAREPIAARL